MSEPAKDHLTSLTPELQHMIFDHLFPSHDPDKAFEPASSSDQATQGKKATPNSHPLDFLAATSKSLRDEVNEWALHFLAQHRAITKYKPFKTTRIQQRRDFLRGRYGLLTWMERHCVFCGNKSGRSAILMSGVRCCGRCDKEQWPDKITKTEARMKYDLKDHQLLPSGSVSPAAAKLLAKHPGLPTVRYGTYMTSNVPTTMFLRKDVEALAVLVHGDLKVHLAKRAADRDEKRRQHKENKARKDLEAARVVEREERREVEEEIWVWRHRSHCVANYGDEGGPSTTPIATDATPSSAVKQARKHKKSLSIDSNAANEGRIVVTPPPKPASSTSSRSTSPESKTAPALPNFTSAWDDLPSMFGMSAEEWDVLAEEQQGPPKQPESVFDRPKYAVLESMCKRDGHQLVEGVWEEERAFGEDGVEWSLPATGV